MYNIRINEIEKTTDDKYELSVVATSGSDNLTCSYNELVEMKKNMFQDNNTLNSHNIEQIEAALES